MKKILLVIPAIVHAGGAEKVMATLANKWTEQGHDVSMLFFNNGERFYHLDDKVHVICMDLMPPQSGIKRKLSLPVIEIKRYRWIERTIKEGSYDFVIAFTDVANILCSIASKRLKNENIFISERNDPLRYPKYWQKMFLRTFKWSKGIICQNEMVKDYYSSHGFENKLLVLPNPVDFSYIPKSMSLERRKVIVNVGRLTEQKNQHLLIQAYGKICEEFPEYILNIYGVGPLEDKLNDLISDMGLGKRVFLKGRKEKVMFEVNQASVFVLSSDFEGFPNGLIEAMATYMPVISSDFKTGVARKLIQSEKNGYLFEPGNVDDLAEKMRMLLKREDEFEEMGRKNRIIAEEYEQSRIVDLWMNTICESMK